MSIKTCRTCNWHWPDKEPQACCHGHGDFWPCDERGWCEDWKLDTRHAETCNPTEEWCCDHCGADLIECNVGVAAGGGAYELDPPILVNYCPNCGRRVTT